MKHVLKIFNVKNAWSPFKQRTKDFMGVKQAASVRNLLDNALQQGFGERWLGKLDYV